MALSRDWYTDANVAAADNSTAALLAKSILWAWKALLIGDETGTNGDTGAPPSGALWTCEGSSDGASANMSGTDLWGASFDGTKIIRGNGGSNARSWIVLKSPDDLGPIYMLISWNSAADTTVRIEFSYNAYAGTSHTADPTSTGSWINTSDGNTDGVVFNDGSTTAHKIHRVIDDDGNFWLLTSKNTSGLFHAVLGVQTLADVRAGDDFNVFSFFHYRASTRGGGAFSTVAAGPNGHFDSSNSIGLGDTQPIVVGGRTYDGAANALGGVVVPALSSNDAGGVYAIGGSGNNSGWRAEINAADGLWDFWPLFVFTLNTTKAGHRGRIPDVHAVVSGPAVGSGAPADATIERAIVGNLALPFGVVPSL